MPMIKPAAIFLFSPTLNQRLYRYIVTGKLSKRMKKFTILLVLTVALQPAFSQDGRKVDSLFASGDTTAVLDSLLKDFDTFLDSMTAHKSFFSVNVGLGTG